MFPLQRHCQAGIAPLRYASSPYGTPHVSQISEWWAFAISTSQTTLRYRPCTCPLLEAARFTCPCLCCRSVSASVVNVLLQSVKEAFWRHGALGHHEKAPLDVPTGHSRSGAICSLDYPCPSRLLHAGPLWTHLGLLLLSQFVNAKQQQSESGCLHRPCCDC
jgi:hypothetical protein